MNLVCVHYKSVTGCSYLDYVKNNKSLGENASWYKRQARVFFDKFLYKVNTEDYYFFVVTAEQRENLEYEIEHFLGDKNIIVQKGDGAVNRRYPECGVNLYWYLLKFNSIPTLTEKANVFV